MTTSVVQNFRVFTPSGPVSGAYIHERAAKCKALLGPVGSGKTVANIYDSLSAAAHMPVCNDGIIRYRRAIIGSTYGQLQRNLYPSWRTWLPDDKGSFTPDSEWEGGGGRSATHTLSWDIRRGGKLIEVRAEYLFAAIGDLVVEEFMRGFEPTDMWLFEMDQLAEAVLTVGMTRIGRYPRTGQEPDAVPQNVAFPYYVCGDLNAPDTDSWFYHLFEEDRPDQFRLFRQPSGRSPQAENRSNLRADYYDNQVAILSKQRNGKYLVRRMVDAQYAPSISGEPVYGELFDDMVHMSAAPLAPLPKVPIVLGFDQGLQRPACVMLQRSSSGQYRVLGECIPGRMNARRFAAHVRRMVEDVAPGVPLADVHYCDPAGLIGADKEAGDYAWAEIVAAELGIVIVGTETNELEPRLTAVSDELSYMIRPGEPALVVDPRCRMLRKGFVSEYRYVRQKIGNSETTTDKPEKNDYSNPHDALQYVLLGLKGRYGVIEGRADPRAPQRALGHKARARRDADDDCVVLDAPFEV